MTYQERLPTRVSASAYPLGDMRLWGMTSHLAGAYIPGASCTVEASENPGQ
jgi:hypothetical protein